MGKSSNKHENDSYVPCMLLKVLGKSVGCAKLQRERINCILVDLFLYGESSVKISTQNGLILAEI